MFQLLVRVDANRRSVLLRTSRVGAAMVPNARTRRTFAVLSASAAILASCTFRSDAALCRVLADRPAGRTEAEWAVYLSSASAVAPEGIADDFARAAEATRRTMNPRIDDAVLLGGRIPDDVLESLGRAEDHTFERCKIDLFHEPGGPVGNRGNG